MEFTRDWFSEHLPVWSDPTGPLQDLHARAANGDPIHILEIGSYEGRSTVWMCEHIAFNPGSKLVTVDHFDGARTTAGIERYMRCLTNTKLTDASCEMELYPAFSADALLDIRRLEQRFDLVYVDGSHHRLETMEDGVSAWRCLSDGGILIFDDFEWPEQPVVSMDHPREAIKAFLHLVAPEAEVIHESYQVIVRKRGAVRHAVAHPHLEPFIVVLAANEGYAAALAVSVSSILRSCNEPSRLLFVLINEGLEAPAAFVGLVESFGAKCSVVCGATSQYPTNSPTWAKLWLDELIPSSAMVLYLDADILCRRDVLELHEFKSDLGTLGAVVDFGVPGHFNAGLMMIDLGQLRTKGLGRRLRERALNGGAQLHSLDQSVLNEVIPLWTRLSIHWNAQGLGTYAVFRTRPEPDFPQLFTTGDFDKMVQDPYIVHFTGAAKFTVSACLNGFVASPTKPWVPHCKNPWRDAWFEALHGTFMRGWKPALAGTSTSIIQETIDALVTIGTDEYCALDDSTASFPLRLSGLLSLPLKTYEVGILLPLRCGPEFPPESWVKALNVSFSRESAKLFIGVDEDDPGWRSCKQAIDKLGLAMPYEVKLFPSVKPAIICPIWASLALTAYRAGCAYLVLWGDDVSVEPTSWFRTVKERLSPSDHACVAPMDMNDPSLATFPIVTRAHFDLFGSLFSPAFINQDADPYLFELYRRIGRAEIMTDIYLSNQRGGASTFVSEAMPRYARQPLVGWKEELLAPSAQKLAEAVGRPLFVTIDVVIPSFRTPFALLHRLTSLVDPPQCSVKFIIVVDDPGAPNVQEILTLQSARVRVRVNRVNMGASASRTRGLAESCAEWVLFLDDDVEVTQDCLDAYARNALTHGAEFSGFVGTTTLPTVSNLLYEATRLSDITFFYNLPDWMGSDVPWGVTANLLVRRVANLEFDTDFAKTGGGEDVDYCIRLVAALGLPLGRAVEAGVTHNWWPCDQPISYLRRFWNWTMGDGHLMYKHPQYVYFSFPNVVELTFALATTVGWLMPWLVALKILAMIWLIEFACETARALSGPESRHLDRKRRLIAAILSPIFKNIVDSGHLAFHLIHLKPAFLMHRFDWFLGKHHAPQVERTKFAKRNVLWMLAISIGVTLTPRLHKEE